MSFLDNAKELIQLSKAVKNAQNKLNTINEQCDEANTAHSAILGNLSKSQEIYDQLIAKAKVDAEKAVVSLNQEAEAKSRSVASLNLEIETLHDKIRLAENLMSEIDRKSENQKRKISRAAILIKSMNNAIERFSVLGSDGKEAALLSELELLEPSITMHSHGQNLKDLRRRLNDNKKTIDDLLKIYQSRYTTKVYATIYSLLVIALKAELQNIIYSLKFDKLDKAIDTVKAMTSKFLAITVDGSQTIAPTITRFIGQIETLFIEAIKIEYEYFIKQEQIKEEQRAIREQMRQEAEERRILEQQKKHLEQEESKYLNEIMNVEALLSEADTEDKREAYSLRLETLSSLVNELESKKEEILKLQNGQAGYVYIISNLGAFGDQMFKIGMTRRQQPLDRIFELGDASVPFSFDIHALIFSDNAVTLENRLHAHFDDKRINKINRRKEFFGVSIEDLQVYVNELEPTSEFNTTMLAEQYRQTLAINEGIIDLTDIVAETEDSEENDLEEVI